MGSQRKRMRPEEIAEETGIGRDAVYSMLRRGVIPNIKFGARYIISRQAFERWWESCGMKQAPREAVQ